MNELPSISVCIATLNAETVLPDCLKRLFSQDYPQDRLELIVSDGGSTDKTVEIVENYGGKVHKNPLKTAEAGKAVAIKYAKNDLILILDSDNFIPDRNWLKMMVAPFRDERIQASEPLFYTWRKEGGKVERYSALIGMNDPLCHFVGNYDRFNLLSNKWTEIPHWEKDRGDYLLVRLNGKGMPTIGANGTFFRRELFDNVTVKDYLFDIDVLSQYVSSHGAIYIAKVKTGIIHTFCEDSISKFVRKQRRRIQDYLHYNSMGARNYRWRRQTLGIMKFVIMTITGFPLIFQTLKGYVRKRDKAWFIHPIMCWITLWVYTTSTVLFKLGLVTADTQRKGWKQ